MINNEESINPKKMSSAECFEVVESNMQPLDEDLTADNFWQGVSVWLTNPHVANRRLFGINVLNSGQLPNCSKRDISLFVEHCVLKDFVHCDGKTLVTEHFGQPEALNEDFVFKDVIASPELGTVYLCRQLLLKTEDKTTDPNMEIIFLDFYNNEVTFIPFTTRGSTMQTKLPYKFKATLSPDMSIKFLLYIKRNGKDQTENWLRTSLFPKVVKWIAAKPREKSAIPSGSLTLIDINKYNCTYNRLKSKYGPYFVKIWPEQTDPLKFVYEDLAIASYLLCLWNCNERESGPTFVDIGCGNGLLVHILNEEGCRGMGLDIRSRKIWSLYPETTKLEVRTVIPSPETLYPEFDWLIGNHSDELTPWIPLLAAQSSLKCNFFLLPCCFFDFWAKYQRKNSSNSQYTEYIEYIGSICEKCGFDVQVDKLRIPSTKRTCLIGRSKSTTITKDDLWNYVNGLKPQAKFTPRPAEEQVRNCTKLPKDLIESVVEIVSKKMFERLKVGEWQSEEGLGMGEVAKLISDDMKSQMKKEFGGLQTLLKNNHSIFQIHGGIVRFRLPKVNLELKSTGRWKNRNCWFFFNHPSGCPLNDAECSFKHECDDQ